VSPNIIIYNQPPDYPKARTGAQTSKNQHRNGDEDGFNLHNLGQLADRNIDSSQRRRLEAYQNELSRKVSGDRAQLL